MQHSDLQLPQDHPDSVQTCLALSQEHQDNANYEAAIAVARHAVSIAPRLGAAVRRMADALMYSGYRIHDAQEWYQRLLEVEPGDARALSALYYFALTRRNFSQASRFAMAADRARPGDPETVARIARAFGFLGDQRSANSHYARAESLCGYFNDTRAHEPLAALAPVLARARGDFKRSEDMSKHLCTSPGNWLAGSSAERYPADALERIARLQARVAGRDLFLFGFGPSLQRIVESKALIAGHDFASMSLTTFPIIEESVLQDLGRCIDMVCLTHPRALSQMAPAIRARASRQPPLHLLLPLWIRNPVVALGNGDLLADGPAQILWFDSVNELPPCAANPLDFPGINTLICALCVAVLARPRRVFLFGFDGGIRGGDAQQSGALYYRESDTRYHAPARDIAAGREETQCYLWWDTLRFNETAPVALRHVGLLFDLPLPPVYNVCSESGLDPFPRISIEQFARLIREAA